MSAGEPTAEEYARYIAHDCRRARLERVRQVQQFLDNLLVTDRQEPDVQRLLETLEKIMEVSMP